MSQNIDQLTYFNTKGIQCKGVGVRTSNTTSLAPCAYINDEIVKYTSKNAIYNVIASGSINSDEYYFSTTFSASWNNNTPPYTMEALKTLVENAPQSMIPAFGVYIPSTGSSLIIYYLSIYKNALSAVTQNNEKKTLEGSMYISNAFLNLII